MSEAVAPIEYTHPVFIVGTPRSGTTLIQGMLCNTGHFFPIPETHFFSRVVHGRPRRLGPKTYRRIHRILSHKSGIEVDLETLSTLKSHKAIFEHIISLYNRDAVPTFLEKTPRHVFFYNHILRLYPSARFICMIREPKNVINSQLLNSPKKNKSVLRLALLYNKISRAIIKIRTNPNVVVVRYEDLTSAPAEHFRQICRFLGIAYKNRYIDRVAAPEQIVAPHEYWKVKNIETDTILTNNPEKWRQTLDDGLSEMVNWLTRSTAVEFDYRSAYRGRNVVRGIKRDWPKFITSAEAKKIFSRVRG